MNKNTAVLEIVGGAADDQPKFSAILNPPATPAATAVAADDQSGHPKLMHSPVITDATKAATDHYFADSEFYTIRGGITAEVIYSPFVKMIGKGIVAQVIKELRKVTLEAFEKSEAEANIYTPDNVMMKNAIFVDNLTVFRKESTIIAYTSSTYLDSNILYLNASMVNPRYNDKHCLGILGHLYTWNKIADTKAEAIDGLQIIMRTRNRDVANIMTHVLKDLAISGDDTTSNEMQNIFMKTSRLVESNYDPESGINREVYPTGLPFGTDGHGDYLNNLFSKLGPCDAYFVSGRINAMRINKILKRELRTFSNERVLIERQ